MINKLIIILLTFFYSLSGNANSDYVELLKQNNKLIRHPTFGLWSVSLADDLEENIHAGVRKIVLWADKHSAKTILFPTLKNDPFFNINTHSDLVEAQQRIGAF